MSIRYIFSGTYDSCSLSLLSISGPRGQPAHANAVAAVESLEFREWNLRLATLRGHEFVSSDEQRVLDLQRLAIAAVDDDGDRGGVIGEVFRQSRKSQFVGVTLDELLENIGGLFGVFVRKAVFARLATSWTARVVGTSRPFGAMWPVRTRRTVRVAWVTWWWVPWCVTISSWLGWGGGTRTRTRTRSVLV